MKGVVFTEFIEMVEDKFSPDIADQIIEASDLESGGIYTSLGTYHHGELVQLVSHLSETTEIAIPDLIKTFGQHLAVRFAAGFPQFFAEKGLFDFLENVESYIHVEVRKLYPDAELPTFVTERDGDNSLVMNYSSTRPFSDLAYGLILGCVEHYDETVEVRYEDTSNGSGRGTAARFTLTRS